MAQKKLKMDLGFSDIWNNMVNFIHYFGYLELGYMEFPLIWDILAGPNAFLVSGIVCIGNLKRILRRILRHFFKRFFPPLDPTPGDRNQGLYISGLSLLHLHRAL